MGGASACWSCLPSGTRPQRGTTRCGSSRRPEMGSPTESADALSLWLNEMAMQLVIHGMVLDGVLEMTYRESAPNAAGVSHPEYVYGLGTPGEPGPAEATAVAEREQQKTGGGIEAMWDGEAMSKSRPEARRVSRPTSQSTGGHRPPATVRPATSTFFQKIAHEWMELRNGRRPLVSRTQHRRLHNRPSCSGPASRPPDPPVDRHPPRIRSARSPSTRARHRAGD